MFSSVNNNIEPFMGDWRGPFLAESYITPQQSLLGGDKRNLVDDTTEGG